MARRSQDIVDQQNRQTAMRIALEPDGAPDRWHVLDMWSQEWIGYCHAPKCKSDDHEFDVGVAIVDAGEFLPRCVLTAGDDDAACMIPLTKNRLAELIADLQTAFERMP